MPAMKAVLPVLAMCVACTPRAVSPQARTFVMESPAAPTAGHGDAQIDFAGAGTIWGPAVDAAGGTLRRTITDQVVVEGNAGLLHVTNDGEGGDRNAYTGRAAVMLR